jgi:uncharacterized protein
MHEMEKLISWVEIPALDLERAIKFYNKVLNIELDTTGCGKEQMACFPTGEGALFTTPGFKPSKDGVVVNLNVSDRLDEALRVIADNGGKVVKPKTKIEGEGEGYFALFIDSEGNRMGLNGK